MDYLVSALEMRELDRRTIEEVGVPGRVLMEVAGRGVAEVCAQSLEGGPARVAVACGTGNNGGDGFVVARALADRGHEVRVFIIGDEARISGDARSALVPVQKIMPEQVTAVTDAKQLWEFGAFLDSADLCVDALLGTGLNKDVRGLVGDAIDVINDSDCAVVAVDIPSGVDSDTGAVMGRAVDADVTVTFALAKRGHYLYPGAALRGQLSVVDIGIPEELADDLGVVTRLVEAEDGPMLLPPRDAGAHKGHFGHAVVLAGSPATPGAAVLALQGALRAGAGLVSWAASDATVAAAPLLPAEVMLRRPADGETLDAWAARLLTDATALVLGPGLSTASERAAELDAVLARCEVPICIDADGLNLFAEDPKRWDALRAPVVLTPHPKEMARLTGTSVADVQRDRVAAALQLALQHSCVVVLKGAGTVIAEPDGAAVIIGAGNAGMATGGTGDVLAGIIGGLLAQGLDPAQAATLGALLHAAAGDEAKSLLGETALLAGDLIDAMGDVLSAWQR